LKAFVPRVEPFEQRVRTFSPQARQISNTYAFLGDQILIIVLLDGVLLFDFGIAARISSAFQRDADRMSWFPAMLSMLNHSLSGLLGKHAFSSSSHVNVE
jgi:hypothetical protein